MASMTVEDRKWRAESDAYALMEAEAIRADKSRMNAALKEAKKLAVKKEKEVKAIKKVANKKPIKNKKQVRKRK